jgi:uncharacterized protein (TIGR00297 family)
MGEEMRGVEEGTRWRKAIPEARDRLQSQVLVWVVGILLTSIVLGLPMFHLFDPDGALSVLAKAVAISVGFAGLVFALRAATIAGAVFGGMICLILVYGTSSSRDSVVPIGVLRSGLIPLAALFVFTSLSTRAGRRIKAKAGLAEKRHGRSASQVIANLATAAMSVSFLGLRFVGGGICCSPGDYARWIHPAMMVMCLAALVEATADTVSSEIGQAFGGMPVLLVGLRRVAVGTDGAVTFLGSGAGIAAGALVCAIGIWALRLNVSEGAIALFAGICGLFFDSLLGATFEQRGWLGNDLVNFSSTVFAAAVALGLLWVLR